jgi:AcrR family transcriptional regulator
MTEKEQRIQETALRLFAQQGYDRTPTSQIAREAGVSEGLIFRHFSNKAGLLKAVIGQGVAQIAQTMSVYEIEKTRGSSLAPEKSLNTEGVVQAHIASSFAMLRQNIGFWRLVQQVRFQESVQTTAHESIGQVNRLILETLMTFFQSRNAADPEAEALTLFALMDGITIHFVQNPETYPLDRIEALVKSKY